MAIRLSFYSTGECDYETTIACDTESVYRTEDGTCNNLESNVRLGSANTPFSRYLEPVYTDGKIYFDER